MIKYMIIILTFIVSLLALFKDQIFKDNVPQEFILLYIVIMIMLTGYQIISTYNEDILGRYFQYTGSITGSQLEIPILKIGSANFALADNFSGPILNIGGDPVNVWLENGILQLQVIIRDKQRNIAAVIYGNTFRVNPSSIFDYNYDNSAIEVLNEYNDVILQVQMVEDGVLFCGKFYLPDGKQLGIGNNVFEIRPQGVPLEITFQKIFKYPGKDNLGIRR